MSDPTPKCPICHSALSGWHEAQADVYEGHYFVARQIPTIYSLAKLPEGLACPRHDGELISIERLKWEIEVHRVKKY